MHTILYVCLCVCACAEGAGVRSSENIFDHHMLAASCAKRHSDNGLKMVYL